MESRSRAQTCGWSVLEMSQRRKLVSTLQAHCCSAVPLILSFSTIARKTWAGRQLSAESRAIMSDNALRIIREAFGTTPKTTGEPAKKPHPPSLPALTWNGHTLYGDQAGIDAVRMALRSVEVERLLSGLIEEGRATAQRKAFGHSSCSCRAEASVAPRRQTVSAPAARVARRLATADCLQIM